MINETMVDVSRLQFALTAMYHFLFVPLTLGLSIILGIMESIYVVTNKPIWKESTKFWAKLFGINFAMGVATGITMEFQFGTNWAYYSHFVGDIFGIPLAIEGMMAFFLESSFIGLMFFGWNKLSKRQHLCVTWLTGIGANLSALWILIANGWMQNPVGAEFNFETMRMELSSFSEIFFNPVAQVKFVHTVSSGYVTGSMFVLAISAFYLLRNRENAIAKRSMVVASVFGLISSITVVFLGDASGYIDAKVQKMKVAAIEAMWETEPAPAAFTLVGIIDQDNMETKYAVKIPYVLGILVTRSLDGVVPGIKELKEESKIRIQNGIKAYEALDYLRTKDKNNEDYKELLKANVADLGYGLLLKKYVANPVDATESDILKAANDTVPNVASLFWGFRIMVGLGFYFILLFGYMFFMSIKNRLDSCRSLLMICLYSLPLPWVAMECGWLVAECGRQPWAVEGILPTFMGVSSVSTTHTIASITGFVVFYTTLLVVDVTLMRKYIKLGPSGLNLSK